MSGASQPKTHATTWTFTILIIVPLLYLLSVPPAYYVSMRWDIFPGAIKSNFHLPPPWLDDYAAPYLWLMGHTPLGVPLTAYWLWCVGMTA